MAAERVVLVPGRERDLAGAVASAVSPDVATTVARVIAGVREGGDAGLLAFRRELESMEAPEQTGVDMATAESALAGLDPDLRESLELAAANIRRVAKAELAPDISESLPQGQEVTIRHRAVDAAGIYVPGGRAAYPSTLLMCCVPAKVAGVERIVVATPAGETGTPHPVILAAAALADVDEVHAMGGAQAIAAMALGTESIEPVDVIVGPGNAYVQEAKRQLFGAVGIDSIAGPSEVVVIADATADAQAVALDLAAQAEHGPDSPVFVIGTDGGVLDAIETAYEQVAGDERLSQLTLVEAETLDSAIAASNAIAPEHLELHCADADAIAEQVGAAGAVFFGEGASAVLGDYVAGSSHVLPTGRSARFSGPLSANTFRRRQALVSLPAGAAQALAPHAARIARAEGLNVHAQSAAARSKDS